MFNTAQSVAELENCIAEVEKSIVVCRSVQPFLKPTARDRNTARISNFVTELVSLEERFYEASVASMYAEADVALASIQ